MRRHSPAIVVEPAGVGFGGRVRDAWHYRRLIPYFGWRFLEKRYARTILGRAWLGLRPAMDVTGQAVVFGGVLTIPVGNAPYPVVFALTLSAWQLFAQGAYWSTRSLELSRREFRSLYIPRLIPLLGSAVSALVEFLVYLSIAAVIVVWYSAIDESFPLTISHQTFLVIPGCVLCLVLGVSVGFLTAPFTARARDLRFGLVYGLGFIYLLTPVIYPLDAIPESFRPLANFNPLTAPIGMIKRGLFDTGEIPITALVVTLGSLLILVSAGLLFFNKHEERAIEAL